MGAAQSTQHFSAAVDSYLGEVADFRYEKSIGNSRFLKTIKGHTSRSGGTVLKVYAKPVIAVSMDRYVSAIQQQKDALAGLPNVLPYSSLFETDRAVYMTRPFLYSNLYDRVSTRPFLNTSEKKWITYQLLRALSETHSREIYHGDIKSENILITTSNWVYLADFASFKPAVLPEDDPADFSFFFDSSSRRSCYVAPERFRSVTEASSSDAVLLTEAMDIFSLGCVIAELFLEGTAIFSFSQLLAYRKGEYDPSSFLVRIEDEGIRTLVESMIQVDPANRLSANHYLQQWKSTIPLEYSSFLHHYCVSLQHGQKSKSINHSDYVISALYHDFPRMAFFLNLQRTSDDENTAFIDCYQPIPPSTTVGDCGYIFLSMITSALRSTSRPCFRYMALELMTALGRNLEDRYRLDRCLPFAISLLQDSDAVVRATAFSTVVDILSSIDSVSVSDSDIFIEYVLPKIQHLVIDRSEIVRTRYASSIATIAEVSLRFLEAAEPNFPADSLLESSSNTIPVTYDKKVLELQEIIQDQLVKLLIDPSADVKRALLREMDMLCLFLGKQKTSEILLSHIITYLNDPDWQLRAAFFESIVGIGTFLGGYNIDLYILPLLLQGLYDCNEFVIERVVSSLKALAELSFFSHLKIRELGHAIAPYLVHPNTWIRYNVIAFLSTSTKGFSNVELLCFIMPTIRPYLKHAIPEVTEQALITSLSLPVTRMDFEAAMNAVQVISPNYIVSPESANFEPLGQSEFLRQLAAHNVADETKPKLTNMMPIISKLASARLKVSLYKSEQFDSSSARSFSISPKTVFLYPEAAKNEDDRSLTPKLQSNSSPYLMGDKSLSQPGSTTQSLQSSFVNLTLDSTAQTHRRTSSTPGQSLSLLRHERKHSARAQASTATANTTAETRSESIELSGIVKESNVVSIKSISKSSPAKSTARSYAFVFEDVMEEIMRGKVSEAFPTTTFTLGDPIPSHIKIKKGGRGSQIASLQSWRPSSVLIANFNEHNDAITGLCLSPDHLFFVSCSLDGSVRVWDCQRLEKNVTNRSRLHYSRQGASYTSMVFCENSHCVAVSSSDGIVEVLKISLSLANNAPPQYSRFAVVKSFTLDDEVPVFLEHYLDSPKNILIVGTNKNNIYGFDMGSDEIAWQLKVPFHYGMLTKMVLDQPYHNWLLCGTRRGALCCFDLRFACIIYRWQHPSRLPIWMLKNVGTTANSKHKRVLIGSGDNEVSTWDIERAECREVLCSRNLDEKITRYARSFKFSDPPSSSDFAYCRKLNSESSTDYQPDRVESAIFSAEGGFIITAGSDKRIRYWDLVNIERSFSIAKSDGQERSYTTSRVERILFHHEKTTKPSSHSRQDSNTSTSMIVNDPSPKRTRKGSERSIPTSASVAKSQVQVAAEEAYIYHKDTISHMVLTTIPYPLLVTADREGIIKVWK